MRGGGWWPLCNARGGGAPPPSLARTWSGVRERRGQRPGRRGRWPPRASRALARPHSPPRVFFLAPAPLPPPSPHSATMAPKPASNCALRRATVSGRAWVGRPARGRPSRKRGAAARCPPCFSGSARRPRAPPRLRAPLYHVTTWRPPPGRTRTKRPPGSRQATAGRPTPAWRPCRWSPEKRGGGGVGRGARRRPAPRPPLDGDAPCALSTGAHARGGAVSTGAKNRARPPPPPRPPGLTWVTMAASLNPPARYSSSASFSSVFSDATMFWPPAWHAAHVFINTRAPSTTSPARAGRGAATIRAAAAAAARRAARGWWCLGGGGGCWGGVGGGAVG